TVLVATWMYNQPAGQEPLSVAISGGTNGKSYPGSPVDKDEPILGQFPLKKKPYSSQRAIASALGLGTTDPNGVNGDYHETQVDTNRYLDAPYGSPFPSRTPTPTPPSPLNERQ